MPKPQTRDGYTEEVTHACERVLVTLLSELGPWRDSFFLIGGLTPRYLVPQGPDTPPHAGTTDVDIVIDQAILADIEAYATLEQNLKKMGFERAENDDGKKVSWRWKTEVDGATMILELLTDAPEIVGNRREARRSRRQHPGGPLRRHRQPHLPQGLRLRGSGRAKGRARPRLLPRQPPRRDGGDRRALPCRARAPAPLRQRQASASVEGLLAAFG